MTWKSCKWTTDRRLLNMVNFAYISYWKIYFIIAHMQTVLQSFRRKKYNSFFLWWWNNITLFCTFLITLFRFGSSTAKWYWRKWNHKKQVIKSIQRASSYSIKVTYQKKLWIKFFHEKTREEKVIPSKKLWTKFFNKKSWENVFFRSSYDDPI